ASRPLNSVRTPAPCGGGRPAVALARRLLEQAGRLAQMLNIFVPASTPARAIVDLSTFVLAITGLIFVVVASLLVYAVVKFRATPANADHEPPQVYGSTQIELAWTVVPVLIVVVLFSATAPVIHPIQ